MLSRLESLFELFGLDPAKMAQSVGALPWFIGSYRVFRASHASARPDFKLGKLYPCLEDRAAESGLANGHYFHGDLLVARRVFERQPKRHADFGSRVDGFVAHVAAFRKIDVFDLRPLSSEVRNITFKQFDLMKGADDSLLGQYDSVSCLHALEHFGLGRYGDDIDYYGHLKGFQAISTAVASGGTFYLSVPMGGQRIEFNAHRVFSLFYLRRMCEPLYRIERFSYVDDGGRLFEDVDMDCAAAEQNYGCHFGLAILELVKK
jgi:Caenorhabditis protein of unknown function, DUF268